MGTIRINIKNGSKADIAIRKHMAEKTKFHEAVRSGNAEEYAKNRRVKFATPIEIK